MRQQLDSLVVQTYPDLEIVVSDDQSNDGTSAILAEYQERHPHLRWSSNPSPAGYAKNFERAIGECRGEIIFLCDQDDIWLPVKVEAHMDAYQDPDVDWVYNRVRLIDRQDGPLGLLEDADPSYYERKSFRQALWGACVLGCATSYRKSALHLAMPIGRYARAHDSWIQLVLHGRGHRFLPQELQLYRLHDSNTAGWNKPHEREVVDKMTAQYVALLGDLTSSAILTRSKKALVRYLYAKKRLKRFLLGRF